MARRQADIYDEWLVLRCQEGDMRALEELTRRWQGRLLRYASGQIGDADAALDVVQEGWLAIVRGIHRLQDPATFRAWAYRIVSNKCADGIRARVRDRKQKKNVAALAESHADIVSSSVDRVGNEIAQLQSALLGLSNEARGLLHLRYVEDMSVPMIASVMELAEGTVKSRLHQLRRQLKNDLETKPTIESKSAKGVDCDDGQ